MVLPGVNETTVPIVAFELLISVVTRSVVASWVFLWVFACANANGATRAKAKTRFVVRLMCLLR